MVKPIFPSQHYNDSRPSDHDLASNNGAGVRGDFLNVPSEDDVRRSEYLPNPSIVFNDDGVFSSYRSFSPGLSQAYSHSFQSYDGSFPCTLPTAAPRGRISSLPDHGEGEVTPIPLQRRRSAPVGMEFSGGERTSYAASEGHSELPPALQDIAAKGQELFWFILSEEVKAQEAVSPGSLSALTISHSSQRMEVLNERGRLGGRTLRQIAEAFSRSSQRSRVREHAERVHLPSLNYNSFSDLLFGLFQEGGVTQARVLVLFFFCADVALRALRENLTKHFQQLVDWTSRYITERLSAWVLAHGGWAAVLQESLHQAYKLVFVGACVIGIVALTTMLWKNR